MGFRTVTALAGIATAVIGAGLGFFPTAGEYPTPSSTAKELVAYYTANAATATAQSVGSVFLFVLITVFATGLWVSLRDAERARGEAWSVVGLLGATATAATYTVAGALALTLARRAASLAGQDGAVFALWDTQNAVYSLGAVFMAMYVGGFSIAGQRTRTMPRWLCAIGYLTVGLVLLGVPGAFTTGTFAVVGYLGGTAGFLIWTLVAAVRLLRASRPLDAAAAPPAREPRGI